MINDARQLPDGHEIETGICIVGAGAAGVSLALELAGSGVDVTLLESGGLEVAIETQSLNMGDIDSNLINYSMMQSRLRLFGGSTTHWAGNCRPLDNIDFEKRSWIPHSGWPIGRSDVDPWYPRAHELCEIGPFDYDPASFATAAAPVVDLKSERIRSYMSIRSAPTRFGTRYRDDVEGAANVDTYVHATVTDIESDPSGQEVRRLHGSTIAGNRFSVKAKAVLLACGAVQNTRLLLVPETNGAGTAWGTNEALGRYFMEHARGVCALLLSIDPKLSFELYRQRWPRLDAGNDPNGTGRCYFYLPEETQRREQLTNVGITIEDAPQRKVAYARRLPELIKAGDFGAEFWQSVGAMAADTDELAIRAYQKYWRRTFQYRKLAFRFFMEQIPEPDNRIQLSDEKDRFGVPGVSIRCHIGETERQSARRSAQILAEEIGRAGVGRVQILEDDPATGWPDVSGGVFGSWHHIGTTRMSQDPKHGVVDSNCKVHGTSNLYVAGSSVFSTGGWTTPTLTNVALSVRLADHVKGLFT